MKWTALFLFALSLIACSPTPDGNGTNRAPSRLGDAVRSVQEVVSFYAFSAKEMHVEITPSGGAQLRWQDQLHDKHNQMRWVPRKYVMNAKTTISGISRDKSGYKIVIENIVGEKKESAFFVAEDEQRAQQLRHALYSIQHHLKRQTTTP